MRFIAFAALTLSVSTFAQQPPPSAGTPPAGTPPAGTPPAPQAGRGGRGGRGAPPIQPKSEELAQIKSKAEQIESLVNPLKAKHADADLIGDVEVYAKAGRFLLEFPELFGTQVAIDHAMTVLDQGIARARQLQNGESPWTTGKKQVHAYYSAVDGSVQPYAITLPENYDPAKAARLYVWLHGRQNNTTESEFIFSQQTFRPGNVPVADQGQIQLDLFGRINSAGWHWAGEADVFEAIAAVRKRFRIDDKRILLRGFSMGGEGAWHIALHYPDRFAAAEIGAGTWSRRSQTPGLQPYQYATLKIWENMEEWALNAFNLPLAGHDGDADTQISSLPGPPPGTPSRGQLESSLRARAQLEKEGFPAEGDADFLRMKGTPDIFLISQNTGHGTSPLVRQRLDAFLKEWGDKGQTSPDHIRFLTYTTRYNRDYWVTVDGLDQHYERADIDAQRSVDGKTGGKTYEIKTRNISQLTLRETEQARELRIDGQTLKLKPAPAIMLEKAGGAWKLTQPTKMASLRKTHALQGPIDDAFIDPFLLVRPTGAAWNEAVNQQALRSLARFERLWAKYFRGHPFVKDDKDVTSADMQKYHIVLFGDPGSNKLIARALARLPVKWTRESVTLGSQTFPANENFPALIYPNPLSPGKYVVLNTGLTIVDREYNGDYGMPQWGDYAIVKANAGSDVPDLVQAGLFNEMWQPGK
ncbi:MAG TPA: alpha/beta hydrolase-fold protein [Candidatus Acidoferrales bacterium]|nr:alpha/beta hydrolase-fold protein [Candidatus Acidoferrales bacterium]